ncbi:hypothetical protein CXG81DRAFT_18990 [Caulochytrium protostelioides]|uniref:CDT1 Geminin-binding domain-containing protein n=1 Tax=Caulochytrium protostelioides TaxID=1555241 RepID=A0A4V1IUN4_9FUNG|nr:hypothetical protein CXG81DRAFT_18990 [Caulochytrium protostelioides]|eukprot:RKP01169.1 hypothetical protein CXG81DRAFT_18990 [Caulochytrium protostelioides]
MARHDMTLQSLFPVRRSGRLTPGAKGLKTSTAAAASPTPSPTPSTATTTATAGLAAAAAAAAAAAKPAPRSLPRTSASYDVTRSGSTPKRARTTRRATAATPKHTANQLSLLDLFGSAIVPKTAAAPSSSSSSSSLSSPPPPPPSDRSSPAPSTLHDHDHDDGAGGRPRSPLTQPPTPSARRSTRQAAASAAARSMAVFTFRDTARTHLPTAPATATSSPTLPLVKPVVVPATATAAVSDVPGPVAPSAAAAATMPVTAPPSPRGVTKVDVVSATTTTATTTVTTMATATASAPPAYHLIDEADVTQGDLPLAGGSGRRKRRHGRVDSDSDDDADAPTASTAAVPPPPMSLRHLTRTPRHGAGLSTTASARRGAPLGLALTPTSSSPGRHVDGDASPRCGAAAMAPLAGAAGPAARRVSGYPTPAAHQRFEHLLQAHGATPRKALPPRLRELQQRFEALEGSLFFFLAKNQPPLFHRLRKPVENMCGLSFSMYHVAQMLALDPTLYRVQPIRTEFQGQRVSSYILAMPWAEKAQHQAGVESLTAANAAAAASSTSAPAQDATATPAKRLPSAPAAVTPIPRTPLADGASPFVTTGVSGGISTSAQSVAQVAVSRKRRFADLLMDHVTDAHARFLQARGHADAAAADAAVDADAPAAKRTLLAWHPEFDLDAVPDVVPVTLPAFQTVAATGALKNPFARSDGVLPSTPTAPTAPVTPTTAAADTTTPAKDATTPLGQQRIGNLHLSSMPAGALRALQKARAHAAMKAASASAGDAAAAGGAATPMASATPLPPAAVMADDAMTAVTPGAKVAAAIAQVDPAAPSTPELRPVAALPTTPTTPAGTRPPTTLPGSPSATPRTPSRTSALLERIRAKQAARTVAAMYAPSPEMQRHAAAMADLPRLATLVHYVFASSNRTALPLAQVVAHVRTSHASGTGAAAPAVVRDLARLAALDPIGKGCEILDLNVTAAATQTGASPAVADSMANRIVRWNGTLTPARVKELLEAQPPAASTAASTATPSAV